MRRHHLCVRFIAASALVFLLGLPARADENGTQLPATKDERVYDPGRWQGGDPAAVPEPGTLALLGLGLAAVAASKRRNKNKGS